MSDEKSIENFPEVTSIGLHSVRNILGSENQLTLFSNHLVEQFTQTYKIKIKEKITRFGIDLTDTQAKVMEGILRGFSKTGYKGNIEPKRHSEIIEQKYAFGNSPAIYQNIKEIPCLRVTQSEILNLAGIRQTSIAEKERAIEAIKELGSRQYCFYYDRLALDNSGAPEKNNDGTWKKEEVIAVDTLFTIKEVRDKQDSNLKFYEIIPSPIFLDQRESYCMLIPFNWREEVRKLVGNKKASSYTFRFLLFLMYQYELKRRSRNKEERPYTIQWSWEEIAISIKMPESIYKRKKARALKILKEVYTVAKQLGYLLDYAQGGAVDILILNEEKYYSSKESKFAIKEKAYSQDQKPACNDAFSEEAVKLFTFFHNEKKKKDSQHIFPNGRVKSTQINIFEGMLKERSFENIAKIITWALGTKYWCTMIGTPAKLRKNFSDAWIEYTNSPEGNKKSRPQKNREYLREIVSSKPYLSQSSIKIELFNNDAEIRYNNHSLITLNYDQNNFIEQVDFYLQKCGFQLSPDEV